MINPAGQIVFELPLEGTGDSVFEIYQDRNGEIVTVFVRDENFYIYRDNQLRGTFQIVSDLEDLPESFSERFTPLQIFYDGSGLMYLVVLEGSNNDQSYLATYIIEVDRLHSEKLASTVINIKFESTYRTKSNLLVRDFYNAHLTAFNPKDLSFKATWEGQDNLWSINDDFVVDEQGQLANL